MNPENEVRLALDAPPLAQDPETMGHRIAAELFPRLVKLAPFRPWPKSGGEADVVVAFGGDASDAKREGVLEVRILLGAPEGEPGLGEQTIIWVVSAHDRDRWLQARPDLGSAQVMVLPIPRAIAGSAGAVHEGAEMPEVAGGIDWDACATWAGEAIVSVLKRRRRRLVSPTYPLVPSEADPANWTVGADGRALAGLAGYPNGATGPAQFGAHMQGDTGATPAWPRWSDRLPAPDAAASRIEGGIRLSGRMKHGSAERPLISYVTVVRNNKATLGRTIQSVQRQTYDNVEHIVLDGASTDGTVDLIQSLAQQIDYFASEPDRGLYDALNKAIELARGQLICVLNSDDWLEPEAAEIAARRLMGRRDPLVILSGAAVESDGRVIEWYPALLHPGCYFACANDCHNAAYATPAAYEKTGAYDTSYKIAADFKWLMACVDQGVPAVYTREITVNYSLGGTSGDVRAHSLECCRVVAERFPALSTEEVHGLYHCFFALGVDKPSLVPHVPADAQVFLKQVAARHAQDAQFMNALAWAMLHAAKPAAAAAGDAQPLPSAPGVRAASRQWVRAVLHRYPRLATAANRVRSRMQRTA